MTSSGAYEDEMGRFLGLSDEELSRLLAGEAGVRDEAFDEVASLLREVRATYATTGPADDARAAHLAAIAEASRLAADKGDPVVRPVSKVHGPVEVQASGLPKWRRVRDKMIGLALRTAATAVAASMSLFGLAYAGVDLPGEAAEKALEAVTGIELPNQEDSEDGKSVSEDVRTVLEGDLEGCELGQAVADAADANRTDDATTETDPCEAAGEAQGSKATGDEKSAEGRAKAAEKSGGRSETAGSDAATDGRDTATEKSSGAADAGADNGGTRADSGADNAGTNDDSGRTTGNDASSDASSRGDSGSESAGTYDDEGRATGSSAAEAGQSNAPDDRP